MQPAGSLLRAPPRRAARPLRAAELAGGDNCLFCARENELSDAPAGCCCGANLHYYDNLAGRPASRDLGEKLVQLIRQLEFSGTKFTLARPPGASLAIPPVRRSPNLPLVSFGRTSPLINKQTNARRCGGAPSSRYCADAQAASCMAPLRGGRETKRGGKRRADLAGAAPILRPAGASRDSILRLAVARLSCGRVARWPQEHKGAGSPPPAARPARPDLIRSRRSGGRRKILNNQTGRRAGGRLLRSFAKCKFRPPSSSGRFWRASEFLRRTREELGAQTKNTDLLCKQLHLSADGASSSAGRAICRHRCRRRCAHWNRQLSDCQVRPRSRT